MNHQTDEVRRSDSVGNLLNGVAVGVAAVLMLPIVLGWYGATYAAEHPEVWEQKWSSRRALVVGLTAVLGIAVLRNQFVALMYPPTWWTLLIVPILWLVTLPFGWIILRFRLARLATELSEGRTAPDLADKRRQAIRSSAISSAREGARKSQLVNSVLGVVIDDDQRDGITRCRDRRGVDRNPSRWVATDTVGLPSAPPRLALIGGSGFGKTWTLHRVVAAALESGWRVAYIDGKGRAEDGHDLVGLAANLGAATVWWRTRGNGGCPFDAWRGNEAQVVAKAMALLGQAQTSPEASDAAKHYRRLNIGSLAAVAGTEPWRSGAELLERLRNPAPWVKDTARLAELLAKTSAASKGEAKRVAAELAPNLDAVGTTLDGGASAVGWCWDEGSGADWDLSIITVNAAEGAAATLPAAVILTDLGAYLNDETRRRPKSCRPLLVILDEAQTLLQSADAPDIATTFEQIRSANAGVVVACQSVQGLGEQGERIIRSGADFLIGNINEADELIELAGTEKVQEVAHQGTDAGALLTGQTAAREQDAYRLDPNRLREAPTGVFALVERGRPVVWTYMCPSQVGSPPTLPT